MLPQMLRYGIPLLLSSLMQELFKIVDVAVLGNLADTESVAAVGSTGNLKNLVLYLFLGISAGSSVLLARAIGSRDAERIKAVVDTSVLFAVGSGVVMAALGWLATPWGLDLINCPPECMDLAVVNVRIYCLFIPVMLLQNFCAGILTTSGNTRSPLLYMMVSGVVKVVLSVALCLLLPNKAAAVALATGISQLVWAVLLMRRLCSGLDAVRFDARSLHWDNTVLGVILGQGVPIGVYKAIFPFANVQLQTEINLFGAICVAGNSAAGSLEYMICAFSNAIGSACAVFVGQNLGAEKPDRVRRAFRLSMLLALTVGNIVSVSTALSGRFWLNLMMPGEAQSVEYGMIRVGIVTGLYGIHFVNTVLGQTVQSFGYSLLSSVNSVLCVLGVRLFWLYFVFPHYRTYGSLVQCYPVSWVFLLAINAAVCAVVLLRYRKGLYKRL